MAVRMMVEEGTPGADRVDNYPGHESRPLWMKSFYVGAVLATRERNYHDDSDFYAVVWDEEEGKVRSVEYATTRGWTYPNGAVVDATDEVKAKARAWMVEHYAKPQIAARAEYEAKRISYGKRVRVVRGRKVPLGTEGRVFWTGAGGGPSWQNRPSRAGIETDAGERYFTAVTNLEVVGWEAELPTPEEVAERAEAWVSHDVWHMPFVSPGMAVI